MVQIHQSKCSIMLILLRPIENILIQAVFEVEGFLVTRDTTG
jgi:hypothetical protein